MYGEQHPIILPAGRICDLIIDDTHRKTAHGGLRLTLCTIRQRYWILNAKRRVKHHIHRCIRCIRYNGKAASQIMVPLPPSRVIPSLPFSHTGLDYGGPVNVRTSPGRGHKVHKVVTLLCLSA